jgi:hypothetical protein
VGKYQAFVLTLLKQIMIPATWMSVDEIYSQLNDLKTNTNKKYVQLPTKHSLAQQMCRFYTKDIKVKKFGARNLYCLLIENPDDISKVIELRKTHNLSADSWPEDWSETHLENHRNALGDWIGYRIEQKKLKQEEEEADEFELW